MCILRTIPRMALLVIETRSNDSGTKASVANGQRSKPQRTRLGLLGIDVERDYLFDL